MTQNEYRKMMAGTKLLELMSRELEQFYNEWCGKGEVIFLLGYKTHELFCSHVREFVHKDYVGAIDKIKSYAGKDIIVNHIHPYKLDVLIKSEPEPVSVPTFLRYEDPSDLNHGGFKFKVDFNDGTRVNDMMLKGHWFDILKDPKGV